MLNLKSNIDNAVLTSNSQANQSEILHLSEQVGYDAHELKWIVAKNADTVKILVRFIDDISCHSQ